MAASSRRPLLWWSLGVIAAVAVAALLIPMRAGAAGPTDPKVAERLAEIKTSLKDVKADAAKRQRALDEANAALNQAEHELAAADEQQIAARAERAQARRALRHAGTQLKRLRKVVGEEARSIYIAGSPTGIVALIQQGDVKDLLDQVALLEHVARSNNDAITDMVIARQEFTLAQAALTKAERESRQAETTIRERIAEALELRDVRAQAKEQLDDKIRELEGEAGVLRVTQQQAAANQAGQRRTGTKCDLSGTSDAEFWIIMHESGGDPYADNPNSTAFGLGQILLDGRKRLLGANYATTDCGLQLQAFRRYVSERYGTAENAKAFWLSHGWY